MGGLLTVAGGEHRRWWTAGTSRSRRRTWWRSREAPSPGRDSEDRERLVENRGVEPDVVVTAPPSEHPRGRGDPQLDAATREALALLRRRRADISSKEKEKEDDNEDEKRRTWCATAGGAARVGRVPCAANARDGVRASSADGGGGCMHAGRAGGTPESPPASASARRSACRMTEALPTACHATCEPCDTIQAMNNLTKPAPLEPTRVRLQSVRQRTVRPEGAAPPKFQRTHHRRIFTLTAIPSYFPVYSALAAANVSRLAPRLHRGQSRHLPDATAPRTRFRALTTSEGQLSLKLIVGLRDPLDLGFAAWSFLSSIGQEGTAGRDAHGDVLSPRFEACNDSSC